MGRWSISRYFAGGSATALPTHLATAQRTARPRPPWSNWTRTISPTMVNEARIGYSRDVIGDLVHRSHRHSGRGRQRQARHPRRPADSPAPARIQIGDGITNIGSGAAIGETAENKYQLGDNLTIAHGRHFFKVGGQIIRFQQNRYYAGNNGALGFFDYSARQVHRLRLRRFPAERTRGERAAAASTGKWGHRHSRVGIFFQDDWKVQKNLTINLGMRWEYTQPVYEVADRQSNFDLATGKQLFAGKDGNSRALFNPYYKQFMPRVGIAWVPDLFKNKLVVRAGYAIISFLEGTGANLRLPLNPPFFFESDTVYDLNTAGRYPHRLHGCPAANVPSGNVRAWDPNLRPQFTSSGTSRWNSSSPARSR